VPRTGGDEAGGGQAVHAVGEQHVAGDLLLHEAGVRLVGIEGANDVVAVRPGVGPRLVLVVAVRVAVMHHVEPVAGPALAVGGRLRPLVDPRLQDGDLLAGQRLTGGRHALAFVTTGDALEEFAFGAFPGNDGRAGIATGERILGAIEPQAVLLLAGAVARV